MWRYLVGLVAGILLVAGGIFWWRSNAVAGQRLPDPPAASEPAAEDAPVPDPPAASEKTREEKRFSRADHDKDGLIARAEYLATRQRNFAKLDKNGDGRLSFDEYAVKGIERFAKADADRSGALTPTEFATTRTVRKAKPSCACGPTRRKADDDEEN